MADSNNSRTITALQKMMSQMQFLVDHPRMQQRNWVARGREWLPILQHALEDLARENGTSNMVTKEPTVVNREAAFLVKVNGVHGETYINVNLAEIKQVVVYRGGEPGYRYVRGAHSAFVLKSGQKYLTTANEAQRLVEALNKWNDK